MSKSNKFSTRERSTANGPVVFSPYNKLQDKLSFLAEDEKAVTTASNSQSTRTRADATHGGLSQHIMGLPACANVCRLRREAASTHCYQRLRRRRQSDHRSTPWHGLPARLNRTKKLPSSTSAARRPRTGCSMLGDLQVQARDVGRVVGDRGGAADVHNPLDTLAHLHVLPVCNATPNGLLFSKGSKMARRRATSAPSVS